LDNESDINKKAHVIGLLVKLVFAQEQQIQGGCKKLVLIASD